MINYISTRGAKAGEFSDALLEGLGEDGGLLVPEIYATVGASLLKKWSTLDYPDLATEVISCFASDFDKGQLSKICKDSYTTNNFGPDIVTIKNVKLSDAKTLYLLGLSNGPTLAFKDIAMQVLGNLFQNVLSEKGQKLNILGATSGDTGSAAEYAMREKKGISVFMLSPKGRMSEFQKSQMYSLYDENIHNLVVPGSFDTCQDLVKSVSNDLEFKQKFSIGSVNSINWGRISAQVVYYFFGYFRVLERAKKELMSPVTFVVPSGNFGNILSGFIAKSMGLPIKNLILATNENNVLDEFFKTGVYRVRSLDETFSTSSPSMDISKASNFERFIFDVTGRDCMQTKNLWDQLRNVGEFKIDSQVLKKIKKSSGVISGSSKHENRINMIKKVYTINRFVVDPHTADGIFVASQNYDNSCPMVCLETALPTKFEETVNEALGFIPDRAKSLQDIEKRQRKFVEIDSSINALKRYIEIHAKPT